MTRENVRTIMAIQDVGAMFARGAACARFDRLVDAGFAWRQPFRTGFIYRLNGREGGYQ